MNVNDEAEELLYNLVTKCLELVVKQKFKSIAFPALGCGYHRFPGSRSADIMFRAIDTYVNSKFQHTLKTVKIVLHPRDELNRKEFMGIKHGIPVVHDNYLSKKILLRRSSLVSQGFDLCVVVGCLSQLEADVLVNTTQGNLDLSVGAVSRTLLTKGGDVIQTECRRQCPGWLEAGQMVQTTGGALKCQKVFHIVLQRWNEGQGGSEETFQSTVMSCLQEASRQGFRSVGFPVLGAGFHEYPPQKSAGLMLATITQFLNENPTASIQTVSVVVAHKDTVMKKNVEWELEGQGDTTDCVTSSVLFGSDYLPGEEAALKGRDVKYFDLIPGQYPTNSIEKNHIESVTSHFYSSVAYDEQERNMYSVTKVEYVVNPVLIRKFRSAQGKMAQHQSGYENPTLAYHGTAEENVKSICTQGFRQPNHPHFETNTDVGWFGNGIYFTEYAWLAKNYMKKSNLVLLCKVLQGKIFKCESMKLGEEKEPGYDSHVDPTNKEIVIYDDECILPCYIVHFKLWQKEQTDK